MTSAPSITLATDTVLEDEPCYGLFELNYPAQGTGKWHRFRIIQVIRNDKVVEYREDLGNANKFVRYPQLRVPGGFVNDQGKLDIVHTVGELRDIANEMRLHSEPHHEVADLVNGYHKEIEKRKDRRKGRVRFAVAKWQ